MEISLAVLTPAQNVTEKHLVPQKQIWKNVITTIESGSLKLSWRLLILSQRVCAYFYMDFGKFLKIGEQKIQNGATMIAEK